MNAAKMLCFEPEKLLCMQRQITQSRIKFFNSYLKLLLAGFCFFLFISCEPAKTKEAESRFVSFVADPKTSDIRFYWKDENGKPFMLLQNLKTHLERKGKKLRFAMNGGMYM